MDKTRVLLVDDDESIRNMYQIGLEHHGFNVVPADNVSRALHLIATEKFDVLLSDLSMPDAGDGFTVVTAMHHTQPAAVTLLLSGYPAIQEAMAAIQDQADEVLVKPFGIAKLVDVMNDRLSKHTTHMKISKEHVAAILEQEKDSTIKRWLAGVNGNEELAAVALNFEQRTGHLPRLMTDLVNRLRRSSNAKPLNSVAAHDHGILRRSQGYTIPMMIEESRILQVSIFNTLHDNLGRVDFDTVLLDVMTIADECDSQLKQTILGFMGSSNLAESEHLTVS